MQHRFLVFILAYFLLDLPTYAQTPVVNNGKQLSVIQKRIIGMMKGLKNNPSKWVQRLVADSVNNLPKGIVKEIGSLQYIIAIDSAKGTRDLGWQLTAYTAINLPGTGDQMIAFAANGIGFNEGGLVSTDAVKLYLAGEQRIRINENLTLVLHGDYDYNRPNLDTYIEFDCNGFKSLKMKASLEFSNTILERDYGANSPPIQAEPVIATCNIFATDLSNIIASISMTPFKVGKLSDLGFEVQEATLDWSDVANPQGYTFPAVYQAQYEGNINLWRGFYLKKLKATYYGTEKNNKEPIIFEVNNMLIDDAGISGVFSVQNLISFGGASADGWEFSIDKLEAQLVQNKLVGGGLGGKINIPFLGDGRLDYLATMRVEEEGTRYSFVVSPEQNKVYEMPFGGTLTLFPNSKISVEKYGKNWFPKAELTGEMTLMATPASGSGQQAEAKNDKLSIPKVTFQELTLTTDAPYLQKGTFSLSGQGQSRLKNFPIAIDKFQLGIFQGKIALEVGISLGFMDSNDKGFSASTIVYVSAGLEKERVSVEDTTKFRHKWKLDNIKIRQVELNCNTTSLYVKGLLTFFDKDPTYGDGFKGRLELKIPSLQGDDSPPFMISMYFGSLPTYRYWQLAVAAPVTIPIVPPLKLKGIMLGASYHMKKKVAQSTFDLSKVQNTADVNSLEDQEAQMLSYVPSDSVGLGLLAGVSWIAGTEKACNGDAVLEIAFNVGGGVRYITFNGSAYFMTNMQQRGVGNAKELKTDVPIYATVDMRYDHTNKTFHANLAAYLNVQGVIKGVGPNNLMGQAVIHIDPQDWYVYMGRPSQRLGVDVIGLATTQSYLMIGSKIDNLPLPPPEVAQVFQDINLSLMRDENSSKQGKGFAFGSRISLGKDIELTPFFISFTAGGGFDIMLKDYSGLQCVGREGPVGIRGWYASGQAYLFLNGCVGIKVKKTPFDIVKLGAAALLQAKLPNPSWLKGALAGNFSVLGGLVKGSFNLSFTIGDECELVATGKELENIEVIQDLKPELNASNVSVFSAPQVTFNTKIGQSLSLENMQGITRNYRVMVEEISVKKDGQNVEGNLVWNANNDVAIYRTGEILPPNANVSFTVRLRWEKQNEQGNWENLTGNGQAVIETKTHSFQTGAAPDFIPDENVAYSYPLKGQYHFYRAEHTQGYVTLEVGQAYLFPNSENEVEWEYFAKFVNGSGEPIYMPIVYDVMQKTVSYNIPSSLQKERNYKLSSIKLPKNRNQSISSNVARTENTTNTESSSVSVTQVNLTSTQTQAIEKALYRNFFRTSKFDTFGQKIDAIANLSNSFDIATGYLYILGKNGTTTEVFDKWELQGGTDQEPLVQTMASSQTNWFTSFAYPTLYQNYPIASDITINWRNPAIYGIEPLKAVKVGTGANSVNLLLTEQQSENALAPTVAGNFNLTYFVSWVAAQDYVELRNKIAQKYFNNANGMPASALSIFNQPFVDISTGNYPVFLRYKLPGKSSYSSEKVIFIGF